MDRGGRPAGNAGFTLLEVMIALAVLAITLVVLLDLRNRDIVLNGHSGNLTTATLLAQERLAALELSGPAGLGEWRGAFPGYEEFAWKMQVTRTSLDFIHQVRLQVVWNEGRRGEEVEMTTYVFDER